MIVNPDRPEEDDRRALELSLCLSLYPSRSHEFTRSSKVHEANRKFYRLFAHVAFPFFMAQIRDSGARLRGNYVITLLLPRQLRK